MSLRRWTELTRTLTAKLLSKETGPSMQRDSKLEPLERRDLMALVPTTSTPIDVAEDNAFTPTSFIESRSDSSLAVDNRGDAVVAYTRVEAIRDPFTGALIRDPITQRTYESNIYARYLTDEVQRIVLPRQAEGGTFHLQHERGNVVNRLKITYGSIPHGPEYNGTGTPSLYTPADESGDSPEFGNATPLKTFISGELLLSYDSNLNGVIEGNEAFTIEVDTSGDSSGIIQDKLRTINGLESATVEYVSPSEYRITHAARTDILGRVAALTLVDDSGLSGLSYPDAKMTIIGQQLDIWDPVNTGQGIRVIAGSTPLQTASLTATQIRTAFTKLGFAVDVLGRYWQPTDEYWFDITFQGKDGMRDWQQLAVPEVKNAQGQTVGHFVSEADNSGGVRVDTQKEPSAPFRVNAEEPANPLTGETRKFFQRDAAVAMDADGEFVITWRGEVPDDVVFRSGTDIFARRYDSMARALGPQFRVNEFTTNSQFAPAIDMDDAGNFVVAWAGEGQDDSFFNNIYARWFNSEGVPLGSSVVVEQNIPNVPQPNGEPSEVSETEFDPEVSLSPTGHTVVMWTTGGQLAAAVYSPDRSRAAARTVVRDVNREYVGGATASFSDANQLSVVWHETAVPPSRNLASFFYRPVEAERIFNTFTQDFQLTTGGGDTPLLLVPVNDPELISLDDAGTTRNYGFDQGGASTARDSDGDTYFTLAGAGFDLAFESRLSNPDPDMRVRNALVTAQNANSAAEQQRLSVLTNSKPASGTYQLFLGQRNLGTFDYEDLETQTVQVVRGADLLDPAAYELSIGGFSRRFVIRAADRTAWGDLPTPDARALAEFTYILSDITKFLNDTPYKGAVVKASKNNLTDFLGTGGFLDFEFTIEFVNNPMEDVPDFRWNRFRDDTLADSYGITTTTKFNVPGQVEYSLQAVLARGTVDIASTYADINGDGKDTNKDGKIDTNKDLVMTARWGGAASGVDIPQVTMVLGFDADFEGVEVVAGFTNDAKLGDSRFTADRLAAAIRGTATNIELWGYEANTVIEAETTYSQLDQINDRTGQNSIGYLKLSLQNTYETAIQSEQDFLDGTGPFYDPTNPRQTLPTFGQGTVADYGGNFYIYTDPDNVLTVPAPNLRTDPAWRVTLENNIRNAIAASGWYGPAFAPGTAGGGTTANDRYFSPVWVRVVPNGEVQSWADTPYAILYEQPNETAYNSFFNGAINPSPVTTAKSYRDYNPIFGDVVVEIVGWAATKQQPIYFQASAFDPRGGNGENYLQVTLPDPQQFPAGINFTAPQQPRPAYASMNWQQIGRARNASADATTAVTPAGDVVTAWTAGAGGQTPIIPLLSPQDPIDPKIRPTVFSSGANVVPLLSVPSLAPLFGPGWNGELVDTDDRLRDFNYNPKIQLQRYDEITDTAGPRVSEFSFSDGARVTRLKQNDVVGAGNVKLMIMAFDEDMSQTGNGSVTNVNNWELVKDGIAVRNGVISVRYGLNLASDLGLGPRTGKFEAVVEFDGNGTRPGSPGLDVGTYQLVAKNSMQDRAGNPLGRRGPILNPADPFYNEANNRAAMQGASQSRAFAVQTNGLTETPVNGARSGRQSTNDGNAQSIAADQDGDFTVAWVSDGSSGAAPGLYLTFYSGKDETQAAIKTREVLVSNNPSAQLPAIAKDGDGDVYLTWAQGSSVAEDELDIFAQRFDAIGNARGAAFRVNDFTPGVQTSPSIGADAQGNFFIAWQSADQEEIEDDSGSGYGIYGKRYNVVADVAGAIQETQFLDIAGEPRGGSFRLSILGQVTEPIPYTTNTGLMSQRIKAALEALPLITVVDVVAATRSTYSITFSGLEGRQNLPLLIPANVELTPSGQVRVQGALDGTTGEVLLNPTTEGDQIYPSVAMAATGQFVVSWTSLGQGADEPFDGNIMARVFKPNAELPSTSSLVTSLVGMLRQANEPEPPVRAEGSGLIRYDDFERESTAEEFKIIGPKWGNPRYGTPATVTYSFMAPGITINDPADPPTVDTVSLDAIMPAGYRNVIRNAFEAWSRVSGITFVERVDGGEPHGEIVPLSADIRIGAHVMDGPSGVLAHAFSPPPPGNNHGRFGDVHFDSEETWQIGNSGDGINLFLVAAHEIGHAIGLDHNRNDPNVLMSVFYNPRLNGLQADDIAGAQFLYGPPTRGGNTGGGAEIPVNQFIRGNQQRSTVAMDANGDFVVAWMSYGQDGGGNGYGPGVDGTQGIIARRFSPDGAANGNEFVVNATLDGDQQFPRASMSAAGDFLIAWESSLELVQGSGVDSNFGVYAQRFVANPATNPLAGPQGRLGGEFRINATLAGDQRAPSASMDNEGNVIAVWTGPGSAGELTDVYFSRLLSRNDRVGAQITSVFVPVTGGYRQVTPNSTIVKSTNGEPNEMYLLFGEDVMGADAGDANSVLSLNNWQITGGPGGRATVATVEYGFNLRASKGIGPASDTWEVRVVLDGDGRRAGNQQLSKGGYELTLSDRVMDRLRNRLDGDRDGANGGVFTFNFVVGDEFRTGTDNTPQRPDFLPDPPGDPRLDPNNPVYVDTPVNQVVINDQIDPDSIADHQEDAVIAMNEAGDYVLIWIQDFVTSRFLVTSNNVTTEAFGTQRSILGQRYNSFGQLIGNTFTVYAEPFRTLTEYQNGPPVWRVNSPAVAMDRLGNFVVTWAGGNLDKNTASFLNDEIWARRYDVTGVPLDQDEELILVNQITDRKQTDPSIAIDDTGDFLVTWTSYSAVSDRSGVFGRRFNAFGDPLTTDFQVNTTSRERQQNSDVAMDANGDAVVVWQSYGQDGSTWGVFGQRLSSSGQKVGPEFRVNQFTDNIQASPRVATDGAGNFVVAWQSGQGPLNTASGYDIYARRYDAVGNATSNEFRVNETTDRWQTDADVAMSSEGDLLITWTSQRGPVKNNFLTEGDDGVYGRVYNPGGTDYVDAISGERLGQFRLHRKVAGQQYRAVAAMDGDGDMAVAWVGDHPSFETVDLVFGGGIFPVPTINEVYTRYMLVNDPAESTLDNGALNLTQIDFPPIPGTVQTGSWTNEVNRLDVNNDGRVSVQDVLILVNSLNRDGAGPLGSAPPRGTVGQFFYDVNRDGRRSVGDILPLINHLNGLAGQKAPPAPAAPPVAEPVVTASKNAVTAAAMAGVASGLALSKGAPTFATSGGLSDAAWGVYGTSDEDDTDRLF